MSAGSGPAGAVPRRMVVLATGNDHKRIEVVEILGPGWDVQVREPGVEETGTTFEENALIKARAVTEATGSVAVADDSGIEIDALGGRPGIHSARWTAEADWIPRVLRELAEVGAAEPAARTARYVAAVAVAWPDGRSAVVRGVVEGRIADAPLGDGGFGYDPIFVPTEADGRTFAQMSADEKHALSHRGRALRQVVDLL